MPSPGGGENGSILEKAPAWLLPACEIISPIVRSLVNGRLEWMRSDAFIWPFDGDPLNCCQAARLSRRGWESQVVAGGWMGRARRGEGARVGDAGGGKGLLPPFSLPSLRLSG